MTIEATDQTSAIARVKQAITARRCTVFAFCNMHTFNLARSSPALAAALSRATVFNDGVGMNTASRLLFGAPFPANLNGTDLIPALLAALDGPLKLFLVGSPPGVAEEAAKVLETRYPHVSVAGCHHGFFTSTEGDQLASRIRVADVDLVLVGMGNPLQELWATENAERTGTVLLCVGAFLDFVSGRIRRAPYVVRAMRAEWLYRLALEPRRLARRYIGGIASFTWALMVERCNRQARDAH